ncbi:MAG: hypothetical protein OHK93_006841 [Ramalina farinacea]|uniref:Uncharacterized protein n=1 Tax=Ramalina farinacea TaxID=258253 RepID=A0AA43QM92_9LECA|nr:hypothetical protein [Ramalina farinacea]
MPRVSVQALFLLTCEVMRHYALEPWQAQAEPENYYTIDYPNIPSSLPQLVIGVIPDSAASFTSSQALWSLWLAAVAEAGDLVHLEGDYAIAQAVPGNPDHMIGEIDYASVVAGSGHNVSAGLSPRAVNEEQDPRTVTDGTFFMKINADAWGGRLDPKKYFATVFESTVDLASKPNRATPLEDQYQYESDNTGYTITYGPAKDSVEPAIYEAVLAGITLLPAAMLAAKTEDECDFKVFRADRVPIVEGGIQMLQRLKTVATT